jgi:hypothetical protein
MWHLLGCIEDWCSAQSQVHVGESRLPSTVAAAVKSKMSS